MTRAGTQRTLTGFHRWGICYCVCWLVASIGAPAHAFTVSIGPGSTKQIYLQVGVGGFVGNLDVGGTPGSNSTVNSASVTVAATSVGNGVGQKFTTNSSIGASSWDGYNYCNTPLQVYIGGFYRSSTANGTTATVTATVPASLVDAAGDKIAFSSISWTSGGNGDSGSEPFAAGTFVAGGSQTVGVIAQNQWAESCWTFSYGNTSVPPQGAYLGTVTYTMVAP